ncbi:MAG: endopeptidase La, partial [Rhodoferax sp.]|nr:endopeptidase La [Rhodoferax sp.]
MTPIESAASQAIRPTPESAQPVLPKDAIAVLPVRNMVLFPGQVVPITVGRDRSIAAANHALQQDQEIGILLQHDAQAEVPEPADLAGIGTLACVLRHVVTPDLTHHIVCQGQQRFRVLEFLPGHPFLVARIERLGEAVSNGNHHIEARTLQLRARALEALEMLPQTAEETLNAVRHIEAPERLTDTVAGYLDLKAAEKQEVLELLDLRQRMDRLLVLLGHRIEVMRISQDIEQHTRVSLDRREREFLLREQMKSIQRELGENGGHGDAELQELRQRLKAAGLPE